MTSIKTFSKGSLDSYQTLFDSLLPWFREHNGEGVIDFRKSGLNRFLDTGFPSLGDEDWRFTNLKELDGFEPNTNSTLASKAPDSSQIDEIPFWRNDYNRLVFVDGYFCDQLSTLRDQPKGVDLMPVSAAIKQGLVRVEEIGQYTSGSNANYFVPLNDALFQDGLYLRVAKGVSVNGVVQVVYLSTGVAGNIHFPRQVVIMGESASATVLEQHHNLVNGSLFKNSVSEIFLGERSNFECVKLQMEPADSLHFGSYFIHATTESQFKFHSFDAGAGLSRNTLKTHLNGTHINGVLNGLYLGKGRQLSDHHMVVEHMQPMCESHEYFNGILDDRARGVFHGRIYVDPKGQKTDAKQTNKNILLTDDVVVDTKPQLEIYADDVKCTHGATIGQLSEESLFYMQARGISKREARRILIHAFAGEIVERIDFEEIRDEVNQIIWDALDHLPSLL